MNDERRLKLLWFLVHRSSFIVLFAACASSPPPPPLPKLTAVPVAVLQSFCARLHDEGVSSLTPFEVVTTTQPLITPESIGGLAEGGFYKRQFDPFVLSDQANREAMPMPVEVPAGSGCAWRGVAEGARRAHDIMTLELSSPFTNPFSRDSYGLLAKVSLARDSATWYWVPLAYRNERWVSGTPMLLGMR